MSREEFPNKWQLNTLRHEVTKKFRQYAGQGIRSLEIWNENQKCHLGNHYSAVTDSRFRKRRKRERKETKHLL
jgi:hypothetical protein